MDLRPSVVLGNYPLLIDGVIMTLWAAAVALSIGVVFGAAGCAVRLSARPAFDRAVRGYVLFFRTTPEMVLIFWGYFCIPFLFKLKVSGFWTGSVVLGLVAAAYLTEIFRAGVQAVPRGQVEAAHALGVPAYSRWRFVILPQALRLMVPPLVNYFTELLKNTTLLSSIGVAELALQAYLLGGRTYRYLEFLSVIALVYFAIIFPLSMASRRLEQRAGSH